MGGSGANDAMSFAGSKINTIIINSRKSGIDRWRRIRGILGSIGVTSTTCGKNIMSAWVGGNINMIMIGSKVNSIIIDGRKSGIDRQRRIRSSFCFSAVRSG